MYDLYGLKHHIVEMSRLYTDGKWKVGQYSAWAESTIVQVDHTEMMMMRIKWRTMKDSRCDGEPCIIAHGQLTSWIKGRLSL